MNKKFQRKITLLCMVLIFSMLAEITIGENEITYAAEVGLFRFAGGDGTENNPYKISTAKQLDAIRNDLDACYELVNDIDLSTLNNGKWMPIGTEENAFKGKLNGNGFTIRNIKSIASPTREVYAMFNYVYRAEFEDLSIINDDGITIYCGRTGYEHTKIAVFIGYGIADITRCYVKADLVGMGYGAEVGLIGANIGGTMKECYTEGRIRGDIAGTYPKYVFVGGIAGVTSAYIENCYSNAIVEVSAGSGASTPGVRVGGIVGQYSGGDNSIKNTYFSGVVQQLSRPSANKDIKGGIVGLWDSGKIESSYYDSERANLEQNDKNARTTDELKQFSTYQSWDFDNVWCRNYFNDGYPFLKNNAIDNIWNEYGNVIELSEENIITIEELFTKYPSYLGKCYLEDLMGHIYENAGKIGTKDSLIDLIIPAWRKNLETGNYIVKSSLKLLFPAIGEKNILKMSIMIILINHWIRYLNCIFHRMKTGQLW